MSNVIKKSLGLNQCRHQRQVLSNRAALVLGGAIRNYNHKTNSNVNQYFHRCGHRHPFHISRRHLSIFNKLCIASPPNSQVEKDLERAIQLVQKYDPAGYLPGILVTNEAKMGYFAVRGFWIDSGLRYREEEGPLISSIARTKQIAGVGQKGVEIPDDERLQKWNEGINSLFDGGSSDNIWQNDATLRLLHHVMQQHTLSKEHFDRILLGREIDVNTKQYATVQSLTGHVEMGCGSLLYLVLECANIYENDVSNDVLYKAAKHIAKTHGLSNALRLSVPKASSTGKIIVPQELCDKYNIKSPRYLLSALGMGDEQCKRFLQWAVEDIVKAARMHLDEARSLHDDIISHPHGEKALSTFLHSLASETFLNRLEEHNFNLTDRKLRNVGMEEHIKCATKMIISSFRKRF